MTKVRGPRFNPRWLPVFHGSLNIFPSLSSCTVINVHVHVHLSLYVMPSAHIPSVYVHVHVQYVLFTKPCTYLSLSLPFSLSPPCQAPCSAVQPCDEGEGVSDPQDQCHSWSDPCQGPGGEVGVCGEEEGEGGRVSEEEGGREGGEVM